MKTSAELVKAGDREAWNRKYGRERKQREWDSVVNSYARWIKMIETGKRLNHPATVTYATSCMNEAELKFPQLKKLFA